MKRHVSLIWFAGIAILLPVGSLLAAEEPAGKAEAGDQPARTVGTYTQDYIAFEREVDLGLRFGWWMADNSGSPTKVGEYQGLGTSSPFWNVEGLLSNGTRTLDFSAAGPEGEATQARAYFFGPMLSADVGYRDFLHRLDHYRFDRQNSGFNDPYINPRISPTTIPAGNAFAYWGQDLNVGQDYAIRVQELKANFKGNITENIRWRLNVWGMEKQGDRQANAMAHCYVSSSTNTATVPANLATRRCHALSQSQQIDWLTMQIEPGIELRLLEGLTVEYSRTMRTFQQSDQIVLRDWNARQNYPFGYPASNVNYQAVPGAYAVVPESYTEVDRVQLKAQLGPCTDAYALGYIGNNNNTTRQLNRHYSGADIRVSNQSIEGLNVTGYGRVYTETTGYPGVLYNTASIYNPIIYSGGETGLLPVPYVNRDEQATGLKTRWQPFHDCSPCSLRGGLAIDAGYEWRKLLRTYAIETISTTPPTPFAQPDTTSNRFFLGATEKWSRSLTSYIRYTFVQYDYPLYGVNVNAQPSVNVAVNSNLPTHEDRVEVGGTWSPDDSLMLSGQFWVEQLSNYGPNVRFTEDNYPFVFVASYMPTCKWTISAGYAQLTNWINQDVTLGFSASGVARTAFNSQFNYGGKSDVVTLSTTYAATERLKLLGGVEYVQGVNEINSATSSPDAIAAGLPYNNDLIRYSRVNVTTWRISAGADYLLRNGITCFARYNFYDYGDNSTPYYSGQTNQYLTGISATY